MTASIYAKEDCPIDVEGISEEFQATNGQQNIAKDRPKRTFFYERKHYSNDKNPQ